jgi:hypothetical protein
VDSALIVRDRDLWVLALLTATILRRELGFGPFVHRSGEAPHPVNDFSLAIVRISGFWSMNALVSPSAFRDLHASFVCGRLGFGHVRALIACK